MSYFDGQIVHDLDTNYPYKVGDGKSSFAWSNVPKRSTHYVFTNTKTLAMPGTIKKAEKLLQDGKITPYITNYSKDHCFQCLCWLSLPPKPNCKNSYHLRHK